MDGVVFTSEYLDGLAEEVNQMLQESGQLRLVELAASFNITTQFLIETLTPRLGTIVSPPPNPLLARLTTSRMSLEPVPTAPLPHHPSLRSR